ncbi:MAG: FliM/FliN family flagellar motor switch protein [Phycisphaerae bacterium]|nr:FliM/FliN family flagellar motor switch protein [Phycisphaerae bacterium]
MTPAPVSNTLTREKLRRLISLARSHPAPEPASVESTDFDWTRPHHFRPEHLAALDLFRRKTVDKITDTFEALCPGPFTVTAEPVEQYFASFLAARIGAHQQNDYFLVLNTPEEKHCGFLCFTTDAATRLIAMMLREAEYIEAPERKLSTLEESILMDIAGAVTDSFMEVLQRFGGSSLIKDRSFAKGVWPLNFEGFNDLACLRYRVQYPQGSLDLTYTLLAGVLEPAAGFEASNRKPATAQELSEKMMRNMHKVPIALAARLCCGAIELDDVMNLRPGDVLLLPKKVAEPMDILLNEKKTFNAYPATFYGKYAAVIAPPDHE